MSLFCQGSILPSLDYLSPGPSLFAKWLLASSNKDCKLVLCVGANPPLSCRVPLTRAFSSQVLFRRVPVVPVASTQRLVFSFEDFCVNNQHSFPCLYYVSQKESLPPSDHGTSSRGEATRSRRSTLPCFMLPFSSNFFLPNAVLPCFCLLRPLGL